MPRRSALVVVGTRPEVIKLAPVVRALRDDGILEPVLVSTGQHREMLDQALAVFGLAPDVDLGVMRRDQSPSGAAARTLLGLHEVLERTDPAWVVVQGDTTTALAAALGAFYARRRVAHVEAGLRSGNRQEPFPEEMNRRLVDQVADLLFAPTARARQALLDEGHPPGRVLLTGNTVVDALLWARRAARALPPGPARARPGAPGRRLVLVTAHRRESFGPGIAGICRALRRIVDEAPDVEIVYPVHLNPRVAEPARRLLAGAPRITLTGPVSYLEFVGLLDRATLVLTDSGGVQEEAPTFGKPILVLRDVTERPEGVEAGVARLVGTSEERIAGEALRLLRDPVAYAEMAHGQSPYGDGHAAERIAAALAAEVAADRSRSGALAVTGIPG